MSNYALFAIGFFLFLTIFSLLLKGEALRQKKLKEKPIIKLAAAIPAYNEELTIAGTVRSLLEAGMGAEHIYILCNGCKDKTADEVRKCGVTPVLAPTKGKEETLTWAQESGLYRRRNYTHICFFDADTRADKNYFKEVKKLLESDPTIDIICGRPRSLPFNYLTAHRAVQYWSFHRVHKAAQARMKSILVVPGCAGVYSLEALKKLVWSPRTRIGDMDATIQAAKLGMKIYFEPNAVVYTQDPSNLRDYTTQLYRRWNRGLWMNMRIHGLLWSGWFSKLNWDCRVMFLDQFTPFLFLIAMAVFHLEYFFWYAIATYWTWSLVEATWCAFEENRPDILNYMLLFPIIKMYDLVLFIASMPSILVKSEKSGAWTSPQRY